jgi:hypothetical protein
VKPRSHLLVQGAVFIVLAVVSSIASTPADGSAVRYGTMSVSGTTEVNLPARLVTVRAPKVATREQGSMSQTRTTQASGSRDMSQLNRDYSARQTGSRQFASRGGGGLQGGRRPRGR